MDAEYMDKLSRIAPSMKNESIFIIGGGSSLPHMFGVPEKTIKAVQDGKKQPAEFSKYMKALHGANVIGVNAAYLLGDWIDVVFFADQSFWRDHGERIMKHPGRKISCNSRFTRTPVKGIEVLHKDRDKRFGIHPDRKMVCWNNNSGAAAISVAAHLGCKRIYLIGFDMHANGGRHFHGEYELKKDPPYQKHLLGFPQIAADAKKMGIEIFNCNENSAIRNFKFKSIKDALKDV